MLKIKDEFPRVYKFIQLSWGTKECRDYLLNLISDSRDGKREGFPLHIAKEIMESLSIHDDLFPQFVDTTTTWIEGNNL